jgi:WD40 repeat protein
LSFSPDGRFLASTALFDNAAKLWDVEARKELAAMQLENSMTGVAFSPDGKTLATSGYDGKLRLWDVSYLQAGD